MGKLSPEAARAKYEYNKKYQNRYWEKKAAENQTEQDEETVSVSRNGRSDKRYISALEDSNKVLNSENRRLVRLLHNYQTIINQSTVGAQ